MPRFVVSRTIEVELMAPDAATAAEAAKQFPFNPTIDRLLVLDPRCTHGGDCPVEGHPNQIHGDLDAR